MEFAREKEVLLDKWCSASKVNDLDFLQELFLLEEFKNCLPDHVAMYLNERKVSSRSAAAVLADKFVLTHKNVYKPTKVEPPLLADRQFKMTHPGLSTSS